MRKSRYQFLPKRDRHAIDLVTPGLLLRVLESGEIRTFNTMIGVLQDLKDVAGRVNEDQEKCLRLPLLLFQTAVSQPEVIKGNSKLDKLD